MSVFLELGAHHYFQAAVYGMVVVDICGSLFSPQRNLPYTMPKA